MPKEIYQEWSNCILESFIESRSDAFRAWRFLGEKSVYRIFYFYHIDICVHAMSLAFRELRHVGESQIAYEDHTVCYAYKEELYNAGQRCLL